jgi:hypothetical protein
MGSDRRSRRRRLVLLAVLVPLLGSLAYGWIRFLEWERGTVPRLGPGGAKAIREEDRKARDTGNALASVRPGMPRSEVEDMLGPPELGSPGGFQEKDGRKVYHTRYQAFLVAPIWCAPNLRGPCEAILEFDATRHGHPLLNVTCTPSPPPVGHVRAV